MNKYVEKALENHKSGYNCSQSIICAYADKLGIDEEKLFKIAEGFGAGMGNRRCTCGALSGAIMLVGYMTSSGNPEGKTKFDTYRLAGELSDRFEEMCKSTVCGEIKGEKMGTQTVSCSDCIRIATELANEILFDRK